MERLAETVMLCSNKAEDELSEPFKRHEVVGLSGTSGGAVCALLAWHHLLRSDGAGAVEALDAFWRDNSATAPYEVETLPSGPGMWQTAPRLVPVSLAFVGIGLMPSFVDNMAKSSL